MPKQTILFAKRAHNSFEASRTVEDAKAVREDAGFDSAFDIHSISDDSTSKRMLERHGLPLTRLERLLKNETMNAGGDGR